MKLISISTDRNVLIDGSQSCYRQIEFAKGFENLEIIIFSKGTNTTAKRISENCIVYPTNSSSRYMYIFDAIRIGKEILRKSNANNYHITAQDPFETGWVGNRLKNQFGTPLEIQIHTDLFSPYFSKLNWTNWVRTKMAKFILPKANTIRVVSARIKNSLEGLNLAAPILIRPIKIDEEKVRQSSISVDLHKKYSRFSKIILMVGRLESEKNYDMAIEAFSLAKKAIPTLGLIIVGDGRKKPNCPNGVILEGQSSEPYSYFKTADLFLHTSWYEGYGLVFKEAEICGLPIISTDVGIARECGATIVNWDKTQIAESIVKKLKS